jgi:putative hydrolase of the HAD superfamily
MLPKAILFDLDDTIISFDGAADTAWKIMCNSFVKEMNTSFDEEALLDSVNEVRTWYWSDPERHRVGRLDMIQARRDIVKKSLENLGYTDLESGWRMADNYSKLQDELICMFPDARITLEKLKSQGIRMALITNGTSEKQRSKIDRFCLSGFFEFCLIEGEVGFGKPDVRVFEIALEKLGLDAGNVWMVGDNLTWDIEAPQKLGIYSIWNDHGKKGLLAQATVKPDRIINSISELIL